MKKLLMMGLIAMAVCLTGLQDAAEAITVYDDFTGENIDTARWGVFKSAPGSPGMFSESSGKLNFLFEQVGDQAPPNGLAERLSSSVLFPGLVEASIEFFNFDTESTNTLSGKGTSLGFRLSNGSNTDRITISRGGDGRGGFFQMSYTLGGVAQPGQSGIFAGFDWSIDSGMLGFVIVGDLIQARYKVGMDPAAVWVNLGPAVAGWDQPMISVIGSIGAKGTTTFEVDNVTYSSVPEPATMLLLGLGLMGLAGTRRKV